MLRGGVGGHPSWVESVGCCIRACRERSETILQIRLRLNEEIYFRLADRTTSTLACNHRLAVSSLPLVGRLVSSQYFVVGAAPGGRVS